MSIVIRNMTEDAFETFYHWSAQHHARELMAEKNISPEAAIEEANAELAGMLPDGLHTENHHLMSILEKSSGEVAGFIWTINEETEEEKQSFLCDFAIWEAKRRRGYATQALYLMEEKAAHGGCQESVLFVADSNAAARALYEKCGYLILRQESYGKYMIKKLKTDL